MHWDDHVSILGHPQVVGLDLLMSKICFYSSSKSGIAPSQHTTCIFPPCMPPFILCLGMFPGRYLVIPCEPAMPEQTRSQWRLATKSRSWQKCNTSATVKRGTCADLQMKYDLNPQDLFVAEDQSCRTYTLLPRRRKVSQNHHTDTKPPRILPSHVKT